MKKNISVFVICCCVTCLFAQKITPTVICNAGAVMKANNVSIEWTLGEIATETLKANNNIISQGFHQTNLTVVSTNNPFISGLKIYPNPVEQELIIENQSGKNIVFHLFNITGQCISEHTFDQGVQALNMNAFPTGTYILEAQSEKQKQNFTIEKIK